MKKIVARDIKLDRVNPTLYDVLDDVNYQELSNIDSDTMNDILSGKEVAISRMVLINNYHSVFAFFENIQCKERAIQLFITHGVIHIEKDHFGFMPIVLIPVYLYSVNGEFYIKKNGNALANPFLNSYIKPYYNAAIFTRILNMFNSAYSIDDYCLQYSGIKGVKVTLENFFGYGITDYPSLVIDHNKFELTSPESVFHHYLSNSDKFNIYSKINSRQIVSIERAANGNSFAITGAIGTGKSETLFNILCNSLNNNKHVLYLAGKRETTNNLVNRLRQMDLPFTKLTYDSNEISVEKEDIRIDNVNFLNELGYYYNILDEYDQNINGRICGYRVVDVAKELIELDKFSSDYTIKDSFDYIHKTEVESLNPILRDADESLVRLSSASNSIFNAIPIDNGLRGPTSVLQVLHKFSDSLNSCLLNVDKLEKEYGFAEIDNFARFRNIINDVTNPILSKIPTVWYKDNFTLFDEAVSLIPKLDSEIKIINKTLEEITSKYKDYKKVNISDYCKKLYGKFFNEETISHVDLIINELDHFEEVAHDINALRGKIKGFYDHMIVKNLYHGDFNSQWFEVIGSVYDYCNNHYYYNKWVDHLYDSFISKFTSVEEKLVEYYKINSRIKALGVTSVSSDLINVLNSHLEKNIGYKYLDVKETQELLSLLESPQYNVKVDKLLASYKEMSGIDYKHGASMVEEFFSFTNFIKNFNSKRVDDLKRIFDKYTRENYISSIGVVYTLLSELRDIVAPFADLFYINKDLANPYTLVNIAENIESYIKNLSKMNKSMCGIVVNNNGKINSSSYFDLKNLLDTYDGCVEGLDNDTYLRVFDSLYSYDKTDVSKTMSCLIVLKNYQNCFINESYAINSLTNAKESLENLLNESKVSISLTTNGIDGYMKFFRADTASLLYTNMSALKENIDKMISKDEELRDYIKITKAVSLLNTYNMPTFALDIYKGECSNCEKLFNKSYFKHLYDFYKETHNLDTHDINDTLSMIINLEDDLIKSNIIKLRRKLRNANHMLTISDIPYFNSYLRSKKYDVILVDDANIYDADDYNSIINARQVIIAGESSYRFTQSNNLINRLRDDNTMVFRHRYVPTPFRILQMFKNLHGVPSSRNMEAIERVGGERIDLFTKLINLGEVSINYFCDNLSIIRKLFDDLFDIFTSKGMSDGDALLYIKDHINIASAESGYVINADYNIIDCDSYSNKFIDDVLAWIGNCALAKEKFILYSNRTFNTILKETKDFNEEFFNRYITLNPSFNLETSKILEDFIESLNKLGIVLTGSYGDISLVCEYEEKTLLLMLIKDPYGGASDIIDIYKDYYLPSFVKDNRPYILWIQDLCDNKEKILSSIKSFMGIK